MVINEDDTKIFHDFVIPNSVPMFYFRGKENTSVLERGGDSEWVIWTFLLRKHLPDPAQRAGESRVKFDVGYPTGEKHKSYGSLAVEVIFFQNVKIFN